MSDTIYALASAPGRGGVAVVRVSGPRARKSLEGLCQTKNPLPRKALLRKIVSPENARLIDHALVLFFKAPASYTGEDVVEYHLHGGHAVVRELLEVLSAQPEHRMAEPGEFTRRAFENGKMDLTEAEAVADLIDAETREQKNQALAQMSGALSRLYKGWMDRLKSALAHLEADLEFPDEDLPGGILPQIYPVLEELMARIAAHLDDNRRGERLRDGLHIAVIGAPNAGKSSLVNLLTQREVAIVSDVAGTTRDVIETHLDLGGYPVIVSDTAGLRPEQLGAGAQARVESEGIRRALERADQADIRLLLFDGTKEPDAHTLALADEKAIIAVNKSDRPLLGVWKGFERPCVRISTLTESGMDSLTGVLIEKIQTLLGRSEDPSLTRVRHREALEDARASLCRALQATLPELVAEDMRLALRSLGRITGRVEVEDLLDVIFADFCIGK